MKAKQMKYGLFILICMCIFPLTSHAECDYQRIAELSRLASNVQINYTYDVSDNVSFNLYVMNLTDDIYVVDSYGNYFAGNGEMNFTYSPLTIAGFSSGTTVKYQIYSNDNNCKNELLLAKSITFPYYNPLSSTSECRSNPNFKYCQLWTNTNGISSSQFDEELNKYNEEKQNTTINENEQTLLSQILILFENPFVRGTGIFLIIIILVTIIFKVILDKKSENGRRY